MCIVIAFKLVTWLVGRNGFFLLLQGTVRAPVFGRHQFFGTSEHYGKAHGSLLSGWMNYNYTACCWFPTSSNILILPSQFWQIRFESCWLHCSKCRILVLFGYLANKQLNKIMWLLINLISNFKSEGLIKRRNFISITVGSKGSEPNYKIHVILLYNNIDIVCRQTALIETQS